MSSMDDILNYFFDKALKWEKKHTARLHYFIELCLQAKTLTEDAYKRKQAEAPHGLLSAKKDFFNLIKELSLNELKDGLVAEFKARFSELLTAIQSKISSEDYAKFKGHIESITPPPVVKLTRGVAAILSPVSTAATEITTEELKASFAETGGVAASLLPMNTATTGIATKELKASFSETQGSANIMPSERRLLLEVVREGYAI